MPIIDGQKTAGKILKEVEAKIKEFKKQGVNPKLTVILVGDDKASLSFIKKKEESCEKAGIDFELFKFPKNIKAEELVAKLNYIQKDKNISGLVVQLPLPEKIETRKVLDQIDPEIDVDCLTAQNLGKLTAGSYLIVPPTAAAVIKLLEEYKVELKGKHIVIVGRGDLVGKPLGILLTQDETTLTICNKFTKNLNFYTKSADILISAVGKKDLIRGEMVKEGVVVLDAGTSFRGTRIFGDVNFSEVAGKASLITPTPGGVGPMTVVCLLGNLVRLLEMRVKI